MEKHVIKSVDVGSVADELGIVAGDSLISIDGHKIEDIFDYEHFVCSAHFVCEFEHCDGSRIECEVDKDMYEPFGLEFSHSLMSEVRSCRNKCIFCFIDQLPPSSRRTQKFKDDDWRLSLIMGNYVTLTNVSDAEFERILDRRISPLYVSVHTTDGELRKRMMSNPTADKLMQRLTRLSENGLHFHAQVVLCPGVNDGDELKKTINELYSLYPCAQSLAVVPVGLTKYRDGLYPLRCMTKDEAIATIDYIHACQERFLAECGTRFVFVSDEMYIAAERELPTVDEYEDMSQIENGVGLLRKLEDEFMYFLSDNDVKPRKKTVEYIGVTGVSAYPFLVSLYEKLETLGIKVELVPITNHFFGETVTVAGLVTAGDIISELGDKAKAKTLLVPQVMLRESEDVFLDNITLTELENSLGCRALVLPCHDGEELLTVLTNDADRFRQ